MKYEDKPKEVGFLEEIESKIDAYKLMDELIDDDHCNSLKIKLNLKIGEELLKFIKEKLKEDY